MKNCKFDSLPSGAVKLHGAVGNAIRNVAECRIKQIDWNKLVTVFRLRNEYVAVRILGQKLTRCHPRMAYDM